jgi:hypothetical protein
LIHKVYGADPMICWQCGGKLRVIAFITDSLSIKQVLEPLGMWSDENERPPPEPREVRVVPVDDGGARDRRGLVGLAACGLSEKDR